MPFEFDTSNVRQRPDESLRFAHICDTHVEGPGDARIIAAACDALHCLDVDMVVLGGDTADHGSEAAYRAVRAALSGLAIPTLHVIGNHDMLGGKDVVKREMGPVNRRLDLGDHTLLSVDSSGRTSLTWEGLFTGAALAWLDDELGRIPTDRRLVLLTHHGIWSQQPHDPKGNLLWDVLNWRPVHELLRGRRLVLACAGHAHQNARQQWGETTMVWTGVLSTVRANHDGVPPGFNVVTVCRDDIEVAWVPVAE